MLVDLGRNDLGRVSRPGTVRPTDLMVIEKYSHVMHLVSHVEGNILPGKNYFDVLSATFPAGTVSGAPKIRAMEVIDELESCDRGPYAGAVLYLDCYGNLDSCIAIRTLFTHGRQVYFQAGAGIVADSTAENEYHEIIHKASALAKACAVS
jgi:anthranilate synthase component 1